MDTDDQARLVKSALEHYKNRLEGFKGKKRDEVEFHVSMFPDIDEEIRKVRAILSKIGDVPHTYGYDGSEAKTMARAVDIYKQDLEKIQSEMEQVFPKIGSQTKKLGDEIEELRKEEFSAC